MKLLGTLLLFFAYSFGLHAQEKPTQEETINFISNTVQGAIGTDFGSSISIKEYTFNYNSLNLYCKKTSDWSGFKYKYENIRWQDFRDFDTDTRVTDIATKVMLNFKTKIASKLSFYNSNGDFITESESYTDQLPFTIPTEKISSFKKAILRLVEIAKEENKDPFAN